jgi:hypothetical protein
MAITRDSAEYLSAPKGGAFAVTPDDDNDLAVGASALYIGVGGDVAVITSLGNTVTFVGVGDGAVLPVRVKRILDTGTTATSIVGLY